MSGSVSRENAEAFVCVWCVYACVCGGDVNVSPWKCLAILTLFKKYFRILEYKSHKKLQK